jgi:copper chaperone CopZ
VDELRFFVPDMTCGHCVAAVRTELGKVPGVRTVDVDLESKAVVVTGQNISRDAVWNAVEEVGYVAHP